MKKVLPFFRIGFTTILIFEVFERFIDVALGIVEDGNLAIVEGR